MEFGQTLRCEPLLSCCALRATGVRGIDTGGTDLICDSGWEREEVSTSLNSSPTRMSCDFRMVHTHLENFHTEHPIVSLHLAATPTRSTRQQFGLFESALRDPNQFYETLARLAALVGHDRVGTPELERTHRPDAFRMVDEAFQTGASCANASAVGLLLRRFRPALPALVKPHRGPPSCRRASPAAP